MQNPSTHLVFHTFWEEAFWSGSKKHLKTMRQIGLVRHIRRIQQSISFMIQGMRDAASKTAGWWFITWLGPYMSVYLPTWHTWPGPYMSVYLPTWHTWPCPDMLNWSWAGGLECFCLLWHRHGPTQDTFWLRLVNKLAFYSSCEIKQLDIWGSDFLFFAWSEMLISAIKSVLVD